MELRVWVDGTQRVVCGVKLTTTCQEIVFALAHATQQAGRFTMIERWRNNERLLSPNEQPLVTLQRWGDRMNEVEFILKKTSTDPPPNQADRAPASQIINQNQSMSQISSTSALQQKKEVNSRIAGDNDLSNHQTSLTNGHGGSPSNHLSLTPTQQSINEQISDNMFQQSRQFNPSRRPQTVLGPLTSSNSTHNLGSTYMQAQVNRINQFKPSLSTSTLPNVSTSMTTASPSNPTSLIRPLYLDDTSLNAKSSPLIKNDSHNGYTIMNDSQQYQSQLANQPRVTSISKNYPHEDLYSTINKKRVDHLPPAVPAKPRLVNSIVNSSHTQPIQSINKVPLNYYQPNQSTVTMYSTNVRPRHPPGYLEYLEAMANRNSLPQPLMPNASYTHQAQVLRGNMFNHQIDQHQLYQQNGSSPAASSTGNCYQMNGQPDRNCLGPSYDLGTSSSLQNINQKFVDSPSIPLNKGSTISVSSNPISQPMPSKNAGHTSEILDNSVQSNSSSVSQMGHDILKVIQEQKKVLMNQKNELDRLDNDQEYLEAKQNSEQAELINRIESEIRQLEELWSENQTQIKKLENQDFESELEHLKGEQVRMELELTSQKKKLSKFEADIAECQAKIEHLESELGSSESEESAVDNEKLVDNRNVTSAGADLKSSLTKPNGSSGSTIHNSDPKNLDCSDDEDYEDDSGGDASDDLNTKLPDSKLRNAKEVPYVDKRGLISGIRSLKLDKSRSLNKSVESFNSNDLSVSRNNNTSPLLTRQTASHNNNIIDGRCSESNGQKFGEKSVKSNTYEFLMTL